MTGRLLPRIALPALKVSVAPGWRRETAGHLTMPGRFAPWFIFFTLASVMIQVATGGYATDRGNHPDEAGHFVSSLAIADYLRGGMARNPLAFARNYYLHFPKLAIGHWPPLFELTQALAFLLPSGAGAGTVAIGLQAGIAGLCAAVPAVYLATYLGLAEGLLAGALVMLSPIVMPMLNLVMADTLVAALVTLTALTWSRFYQRRGWADGLLFALAASGAILTKGTGFGLALLPPFYLLYKGDPGFLLNRKTLAAAVLVGVLTLPWYVLTYKMAAAGFVYRWGWDYTGLAVPFFLKGLVGCFGGLVLLAFAAGLVFLGRNGKARGRRAAATAPDIAAFAASTLAMLAFMVIAPADLDRRYLISIVPGVAIVAIWGLSQALALLSAGPGRTQTLLAVLVAGSIATHFSVPRPRSFHAGQMIRTIMAAAAPNRLVLVSGSGMAEGAFISSFAERDPAADYYVLRGQKALAQTNWMATDYTLRFASAQAMADWIRLQHIGWIVLDQDDRQPDMPHNAMLRKAVTQPMLSAKLVQTISHPGGQMALYALPAAALPGQMTASLAATAGPGHLE